MNELLTIIFNLFILPFEKVLLHKRRKELITNVKGKVLEIGSGGGVNFNYYNSKNIVELQHSLRSSHQPKANLVDRYVSGWFESDI